MSSPTRKQFADAAPATDRRAHTSRDVARLAGVSQPTVSLVLGGRGDEIRVAPATQARVLAAASQLGYVANQAARSLRRRSSRVITLISPTLENPFFAEVAATVQDAATARGYATNVVLARDAQEEARAIAHVRGGAADALVVASHFAANGDALNRLASQGTPCVVLQQLRPGLSVPSIAVDLEQGGWLATRHLLGLGHRRIAHVTQIGAAPDDSRKAGYLRALREADVTPDPALLVEAENALAGGSLAARLLLELPHRPTAIFAYNDRLALGVLHGAHQAGIGIPAQLSVVGFDNTVSAGFSVPELTSVGHERNRLTVAMLFAMLDGDAVAPLPQTVPVRLVVRQSCGAPPD